MAEVEAALAAGRLPILVGGTGLYLRSFAEGLSAVPEVPPEVRRTARAEMMTLGAAAFHARLAAHDPVMAARLAPGDRQRLLRAWEVFTATGRSLADRSEEHTSELQSLMRNSYTVFCLKKKTKSR